MLIDLLPFHTHPTVGSHNKPARTETDTFGRVFHYLFKKNI